MTALMAPSTWDLDRMLPAFGMALCLHIAVFLSLPYLNHPPVPPPLRVEIDLTQATLQPVALPPQPTPPQPEPSKPKPVSPKTISQPHQQALPLLTARADIPPTPQDKVVPDIPANQPPVPIVPTAPASTSTDSAPAETVTARCFMKWPRRTKLTHKLPSVAACKAELRSAPDLIWASW